MIKVVYLQRSGAELQAHQDGSVHQLCYSWVGHLQGVLDQVGDIHLPVRPQHCDDLVSSLCRGGVELGQHLDQSPLVLQGAASAHPALVIFLLCVAVSSAPWETQMESDKTFSDSTVSLIFKPMGPRVKQRAKQLN